MLELYGYGWSNSQLLKFVLSRQVQTVQVFSEQSVEQSLEGLNMSLELQLAQAVIQVGNAAVQNGSNLIPARTPLNRKATSLLYDLGLAKDGSILQTSITARTSLSSPARVSNYTTAFGQRLLLLENGWTIADTGRFASVEERALNRCQCKEYYRLLTLHYDAMLAYERAGWLSHSQQEHYYKTLGVAFEVEAQSNQPYHDDEPCSFSWYFELLIVMVLFLCCYFKIFLWT